MHPAFFVANLLDAPLRRHWTRTFMLIGIMNSVFIVLAAAAIQPAILQIRGLEGFVAYFLLYSFTFYNYVTFTDLLRGKTLQVFDTSPCLIKLAIIRISSIRKLAFMGSIAMNLILFLTTFEVKLPSVLIGTPVYLALNVQYLTSFKIHPDKEREAIFEGLSELKSLPEFYQLMTLRRIMRLAQNRIQAKLRLARQVHINPVMRWLYLQFGADTGDPSQEAREFADKLKTSLGKSDADLVELLSNAQTIKDAANTEPVSFLLPWESRANWGQILGIVFGILDAITALFYLRAFGVFDYVYKILTGGG